MELFRLGILTYKGNFRESQIERKGSYLKLNINQHPKI